MCEAGILVGLFCCSHNGFFHWLRCIKLFSWLIFIEMLNIFKHEWMVDIRQTSFQTPFCYKNSEVFLRSKFNWHCVNVGLGNGLTPSMWLAITWTSNYPVHSCIYWWLCARLAVLSPLPKHWRYCCLAPNHRYDQYSNVLTYWYNAIQ